MFSSLRTPELKNRKRRTTNGNSLRLYRGARVIVACLFVASAVVVEVPQGLAKREPPTPTTTTVTYPTTTTTVYTSTTTTAYKPTTTTVHNPVSTTTTYKPTTITTAPQSSSSVSANITTSTTLPHATAIATVKPSLIPKDNALIMTDNSLLPYPSIIDTDSMYSGSIDDSGIVTLAKTMQGLNSSSQKETSNMRPRRVGTLPAYFSWLPVVLLIITAAAGIVAKVKKRSNLGA